MALVPGDLKYTQDHEWVRMKDGIATVGITDYAQGELGDVVFLELPAIGVEARMGEPFGSIEAVKTVADLYAPVSGEIIDVNTTLEDSPEMVNSDPYGTGWLIKIMASDPTELDSLMDAAAYKKHIA